MLSLSDQKQSCGFSTIHNDPKIGILRAIRCSPTLATLVARPDVIDGILESQHRLMNIDVSKTPWVKGKVSCSVLFADMLLLYPDVFAKTKGQERQILRRYCDDYKNMKEANKKHGGEDQMYSAPFNTHKMIALRLVKQLDSKEHDRLVKYIAIKDEDKLFAGIEQFINRRQ